MDTQILALAESCLLVVCEVAEVGGGVVGKLEGSAVTQRVFDVLPEACAAHWFAGRGEQLSYFGATECGAGLARFVLVDPLGKL